MNDMNQRTLIIEITKGAVDTLFFYILRLTRFPMIRTHTALIGPRAGWEA